MLFSEFCEGIGCKDNRHSYQLYEIIERDYNAGVEDHAHYYDIVRDFMNDNQRNVLTKGEWDDLYEQLCYAYSMLLMMGKNVKTQEERRIFDEQIDINMKLRTKLAEPGKYGNEL